MKLPPISLTSLAALLFAWQIAPFAAHAEELSPQMRLQMEAVVRDYLLKNPELIRDASRELAVREAAQKQATAAKAIAENREALERDPESPVGGNPLGDITVVEFFDYNCGFCKRVASNLKALTDADKNVRVIYKELPILGPSSLLGSKAALAAKRQGKYVAFHEALFELPEISDATLKELSARLGLDHARLLSDMADPALMKQIERDHALARMLDINGTPGFVIGDHIEPGAVETAVLQEIVNEQRVAARTRK